MLCVAFMGALRGEEVVRISLGGVRKYWSEGVYHPFTPHISMILSGRFKQETGEKFFCQHMAMTSKSGINLRLWTERVIINYEKLGVNSGPIFRVLVNGKVKRASCGDLDIKLHDILQRVQNAFPRLIV